MFIFIGGIAIGAVAQVHAIEPSFALPCVGSEACSQPRIELVAQANLYVWRNEITEFRFAERILCAALYLQEHVALELLSGFFIDLLSRGARCHGEHGGCHQVSFLHCFSCFVGFRGCLFFKWLVQQF